MVVDLILSSRLLSIDAVTCLYLRSCWNKVRKCLFSQGECWRSQKSMFGVGDRLKKVREVLRQGDPGATKTDELGTNL